MSKHFDIIIKHGTILQMDKGLNVLTDHVVAIRDRKICAIEPLAHFTGNAGIEGVSFHSARTVIDATDCIVMPGLINAHTHLPMSYMRGLADDLPLDKWLKDYIWPAEDKLLNDELGDKFIYDATLYGAAEVIRSGTTMVSDMYFKGEQMGRALVDAGLRGIIGEAVTDLIQANGKDRIGEYAVDMNREFASTNLVEFSVAPHAIYSCSENVLRKCAKAAIDNDLLLHIHISESEKERNDCIVKHGKRPVEYLAQTGFLDARTILAHGIWVDKDELTLLAERNISVATCTESNLKLCSGILPLRDYMETGVNLCLATDGAASNNNLDLFTEMDTTAKIHKMINHDPALLPAHDVVKMVTCNAAKAIYREHELGSLLPGYLADITIVALDTLNSQPIFNPYSHLVYALNGHNVRDVIINGKLVLKNRKLTTLDEKALIATAKHYQEKICRILPL